tara:strand:+ start:2377 stop:2625 length:249 start_codon:yes stop_codon:yes gene_type:complete
VLGIISFEFIDSLVQKGGYFLIGLAFPFGVMLVGSIELLSERPIEQLELVWEEMPNWKKFTVSLLVASSACVIALGAIVFFG